MVAPMYRKIQQEIAQAGLLNDAGLPLQGITISELEALEEGVGGAMTLQRLLAQKASDEEWRGTSVKNFCFARYLELITKRNGFLERRFQELFTTTVRFFREHHGSELM